MDLNMLPQATKKLQTLIVSTRSIKSQLKTYKTRTPKRNQVKPKWFKILREIKMKL